MILQPSVSFLKVALVPLVGDKLEIPIWMCL